MVTIQESASNISPSTKGSLNMLTLPVAPLAFCRRLFDAPASPARAVPPAGALNWLEENLQAGAAITAVDISGPGDPLAEIDVTMETVRLVRQKYPDLMLSLTTLGIHAGEFAQSLAEAGVTGVTLLVDAVDPEVAGKLYAWIRPATKTIPLPQATAMLMQEQSDALRFFKEAACRVTIRSTVYPGFNDHHIGEIARVMAGAGADAMILVPCKNVPTAEEEDQGLTPPDLETMEGLRKSAAQYLEAFLAAEKANCIGADCPSLHGAWAGLAALRPQPTPQRPNVAVVSATGMDVDLHLGQAYQVLIYGPREDGLPCLLGTRPVPEPGSGGSRWEELAGSLKDCFAILASSAGESPRNILAKHGITVLITDTEIAGAVDFLYGGGTKARRH